MTNKYELTQQINNHCLVDWIRKMTREDLLSEFGYNFAVMKGFNQNNPHHCYDLLEHTLHTVSSIDATGLDIQSKLFIQTAALFHDIGKPLVVKDKVGRSVYYGHAKKSKYISMPILKQMGFTNREIKYICFLIEHHDDFLNYKMPEELPNKYNPHIYPIDTTHLSEYYSHLCETTLPIIGRYPTYQDVLLLLRLSSADASAQANISFDSKGEVIDTRINKLKRYTKIETFFLNIVKHQYNLILQI